MEMRFRVQGGLAVGSGEELQSVWGLVQASSEDGAEGGAGAHPPDAVCFETETRGAGEFIGRQNGLLPGAGFGKRNGPNVDKRQDLF